MKKEKIKIAIVEDDPFIADFMRIVAQDMDFNVVLVCLEADDAVDKVLDSRAQIVLLDINLKIGREGIKIGRELKSLEIMIIYVTAYTQASVINEALVNNPENYLIKPITEQELKIALSIVREKYKEKYLSAKSGRFCWGDGCCFDFNNSILSIRGEKVPLTPIETRMVEYFCKNTNKVISRSELMYTVWGGKDIGDTTIRECVYRLRKKIPCFPLVSVSKIGYEFKYIQPNDA